MPLSSHYSLPLLKSLDFRHYSYITRKFLSILFKTPNQLAAFHPFYGVPGHVLVHVLQGIRIADRIAGHSGIQSRHALHVDVLDWRSQDALLLLILLLGGGSTGGFGAGAAAAAVVRVVRRQGFLGLTQWSAAAGQRAHRCISRRTGEVMQDAAHRGGDGNSAEMQSRWLGGSGWCGSRLAVLVLVLVVAQLHLVLRLVAATLLAGVFLEVQLRMQLLHGTAGSVDSLHIDVSLLIVVIQTGRVSGAGRSARGPGCVLQVQGGTIDRALVAATLVAQAEGIRWAAPNIILAAVDRVVLLVLVVEVPAQVPAEQLQQTPGAGKLLGPIPWVTMKLLLLLLLAEIHGGTGRRTAAGARLRAIIGWQSIHGVSLNFISIFQNISSLSSLFLHWHSNSVRVLAFSLVCFPRELVSG